MKLSFESRVGLSMLAFDTKPGRSKQPMLSPISMNQIVPNPIDRTKPASKGEERACNQHNLAPTGNNNNNNRPPKVQQQQSRTLGTNFSRKYATAAAAPLTSRPITQHTPAPTSNDPNKGKIRMHLCSVPMSPTRTPRAQRSQKRQP